MSNKENPSAGHLIEASKLAVFLPDDQRPAFDECLGERDFDTALSMLDRAIPNGVACPTQIFILSETDTGDADLEQDTPYAYFDEEDLYEMREKPDLIRLREKIGEAPAAHSWTIWG
jgi:hypothetical protein